MIMLKNYSQTNNTVSFILLSINLLYFSFLYCIAPYQEMQERIKGVHEDYIGYAVHFIALLVLALHLVITLKTAIKRTNFIIAAKSALIWVFGIFSIVIVSNEVLLNTMVLKMMSFVRADDIDIAESVYYSIHTQAIKIGLPITWGILAFTFLSVGISRQLKPLRVIALVLLAVTLLKLFIYDINDVSEAGKIIAFIILGVVLLVMSFMYQKIKALILSEENTATLQTNSENTDETNIS